jgi:hypothetical protein
LAGFWQDDETWNPLKRFKNDQVQVKEVQIPFKFQIKPKYFEKKKLSKIRVSHKYS